MRIVKPIGMTCPAWRPPGGSASSLVTAPSLARAVPARAPSARSVPIARTLMRRMRSSERWLHGPCATQPPYNEWPGRFPSLRKDVLGGPDDPRRPHGEQQEERDEHENGGPDE